MERDKLTDMLKGYACLLVVFGHIIIGIRTSGISVPYFLPITEKFIWSFHIDLFMFLSGYVYSITGGFARSGGRKKFIISKLFGLGVPYLIFSIAYIAVNSLTPGVNNAYVISDIFTLLYKPVAQYWFIYALFWLFVLWTVFSELLSDAAITILLYAVFLAFKFFKINLGFLDSSFNCVLAFGLGTCLHSIQIKKIQPILRVAITSLHASTTIKAIQTGFYEHFFMDDIFTVFGIFSSICLISLFTNFSPISSSLQYICRYSFPIYLLHTFFTAATRILLLKFGVQNLFLHIAAASVNGIIFPIVIAKLFSLTPYLNFFFYPVKSIRQIRTRRNIERSL